MHAKYFAYPSYPFQAASMAPCASFSPFFAHLGLLAEPMGVARRKTCEEGKSRVSYLSLPMAFLQLLWRNPMDRRRFLLALCALAGSSLLSACTQPGYYGGHRPPPPPPPCGLLAMQYGPVSQVTLVTPAPGGYYIGTAASCGPLRVAAARMVFG